MSWLSVINARTTPKLTKLTCKGTKKNGNKQANE
jgi:hypothetical protein